MAYDACQISVNLKNVTKEDLLKVNKSIRRLKAENIELRFPDLGDPAKARFILFSHTSLVNLSDGGSQNFAPLIWKSKKIEHIVKITIAAETLALLEGAENRCLMNQYCRNCSIIKKEKR